MLVFMDEWKAFYVKKDLYAMDHLHLRQKGMNILRDKLERINKNKRIKMKEYLDIDLTYF